MGPLCCPRIVGRERTVQRDVAQNQSFVIDRRSGPNSTVLYLSEDGRLDVERGAEGGTAEEGKEGRGKERHEHLRIPLLRSNARNEEKGGGGKEGAKHCSKEVKNINKRRKISRFGCRPSCLSSASAVVAVARCRRSFHTTEISHASLFPTSVKMVSITIQSIE